MPKVSRLGEPLGSREWEVEVVASLLLPHTPPRTLWPVHETGGTTLHMLVEVLWHLVQLGVAPSTEERDPKVLPRMIIGGGGVFVHHPTVRAECYLILQIFAVIEGHPRQTLPLVQLVYPQPIRGLSAIQCRECCCLLLSPL